MQPELHAGERVLQRRCFCGGRFLQLKLNDLYKCVPGLFGDASRKPARDEPGTGGYELPQKEPPTYVTLELLGLRIHTSQKTFPGALECSQAP